MAASRAHLSVNPLPRRGRSRSSSGFRRPRSRARSVSATWTGVPFAAGKVKRPEKRSDDGRRRELSDHVAALTPRVWDRKKPELRERRRLSREDELLPPAPQRHGPRRAAIPDPHRRRELRPRVAVEVHLLSGRQEARRAALLHLELHLPQTLRRGPGGVPEIERPPAPLPLPALVRNGGTQELAIRIVKLHRHVVPRGIDVGETRLREDGGERQVPLHRSGGAWDDKYLLHLHRRRLRAAGGILVVGPPVAVIIHAVVTGLRGRERGGGRRRGEGGRRRGERGRRRGERGGRRGEGGGGRGGGGRRRGNRARLHGADVAARSLRTGDTPLVGGRRGAAGSRVDRRAAGEERPGLQEGGARGVVLQRAEQRIGVRQVARDRRRARAAAVDVVAVGHDAPAAVGGGVRREDGVPELHGAGPVIGGPAAAARAVPGHRAAVEEDGAIVP